MIGKASYSPALAAEFIKNPAPDIRGWERVAVLSGRNREGGFHHAYSPDFGHVIGGRRSDDYDAYRSSDGVSWQDFAVDNRARYGASLIVDGYWFNWGGRYVTGGGTEYFYPDIERFGDDGSASFFAEDLAITRPAALMFNNEVWLLGNYEGVGSGFQVHRSSGNRTAMIRRSVEVGAMPKCAPAAIVHNGRIWIFGGGEVSGAVYDGIYSTADGRVWRTEGALPLPLAGHSVVSFKGKYWIIGGYSSVQGLEGGSNRVYVSDNLLEWELYHNADFSPRAWHGCVVADDAIYVSCGDLQDGDTGGSEIWKTI